MSTSFFVVPRNTSPEGWEDLADDSGRVSPEVTAASVTVAIAAAPPQPMMASSGDSRSVSAKFATPPRSPVAAPRLPPPSQPAATPPQPSFARDALVAAPTSHSLAVPAGTSAAVDSGVRMLLSDAELAAAVAAAEDLSEARLEASANLLAADAAADEARARSEAIVAEARAAWAAELIANTELADAEAAVIVAQGEDRAMAQRIWEEDEAALVAADLAVDSNDDDARLAQELAAASAARRIAAEADEQDLAQYMPPRLCDCLGARSGFHRSDCVLACGPRRA